MAAVEVGAERERLRAATEMLLESLDDGELPLRIVEAGCALAGAGRAALGIAPAVGGDVQLVHLGLRADLEERLTRLTAGDRVLEQVVDAPPGAPQPRTAMLEADSSVDGPWQRTLLSAPIRAGSGLYGQLYIVSNEESGGLTEGTLATFAAAAGLAVSHAQLRHRATVRERWGVASRRFLGGLLREQDDDETAAWQQLVSIVADAAAAYGVAITVVDRDDPTTVVIPASVGGMESWSGRRIPRTNSITHAVVASGRPLIIADAATDPRTVGVASRAPEVGPVAAAPVIDGAGGTLEAALIVARTHNQEPFDPVEGELVAGFAVEAGAALALVRARRDRARLRRFEERERLASELNQRTLRRLIGVELALSGLLAESPTGDHRRRLSRQFDEVSNLVKDMRRVVFEAANHLDPLE
jgi:GAF domain-containing protein